MPSQLCGCGCGATSTRGEFLRGHNVRHAIALQRLGTDASVRELAYRGWSRWNPVEAVSGGPGASSFGVEAEFFGLGRDDAVRLLNNAGVNAQNDGYHHEARDFWRVTSDSSVHGEGNELVSPILNFKKEPHFRTIKRVTDTLKENGGDIDRTCGVHVHHSAEGLTPLLLADAITTYSLFQGPIDRILPKSRRVFGAQRDRDAFNSPIQRLDSINSQLRDPSMTERNMGGISGMTRHQVMNIHALAAHNTIEFRQHSGSLNPSKINNWVKFTKLFMTIGKKKPAMNLLRDFDWNEENIRTEFNNITKVLDYLEAPDGLKEYYTAREAAFAAAEEDEEDKFASIHFSYRNTGAHEVSMSTDDGNSEWCAQCAMFHPFQADAEVPYEQDYEEPDNDDYNDD